MFEVVVEDRGVEYVAFSADTQAEAELLLQRHIRSLTPGMAYIREVAKDR